MPVYIIISIIFAICVFLKLKKTNSIRLLKASLWLTISYSFLILTHLFSGISYNSGNVLRILPYLFLCLLLIVIGERLGKRIKLQSSRKLLRIKLSTLSYLAIVGSIIFIYDIIRHNQITFGTRIEDFQISIIGVIGNILSSLGIIAWLIGLYEYRMMNTKIPFYSYLSIISFVAGGILSAGRQSIILIALSSFIMYIWSNRKRKELEPIYNPRNSKKKKPWGIILFSFIFISYFLIISNVRSGIFDINRKMNMLENFFNARISEKTLTDVKKMGSLSDIYIESLFYYSHQLSRLDLLYQHYDYYPLLGLSQLSYVERRLQWLVGKQGDLSWRKVEIAIEQKGNFSSHTWGTFITNYIIDFGRFGTLFMCLLTGIAIGICHKSLKDNETPEKVIRHCLIIAGVIFSIQFSPFAELIWIFPLILITIIKIDLREHIDNSYHIINEN